MGLTRQQCKLLGIEHLYPTEAKPLPVVTPPAKSRHVDDGLNKLERAFWERLQDAQKAGVFEDAYSHQLKLKVIGNRWYYPDFHAARSRVSTIFETKGWMREDAELKLIAAAERYPCFEWVLVTREKRRWGCRHVTRHGISPTVWCPEWLS